MRESLYKVKRMFIVWSLVMLCMGYPLAVCWFVWWGMLKLLGVV